MSALRHKKILLGISGSIAAYKSAILARLLIKEGAEVKVIMTRSAADFITPLTLHTLTRQPVVTDLVTDEAWNNHVELGLWADIMLIAPATAQTISKMAAGSCDNLLTATYLSAKCPVCVAPAMDLDMWKHPATRRNLAAIQQDGVSVIPVGYGELASGLVGDGRMAEPEEIVDYLKEKWNNTLPLSGKTVLVTAGPTQENIDPVRYIGNRSSGKMGIAIANELATRGAQVHLILGPVSSSNEIHSGVVIHPVQTADDMLHMSRELYGKGTRAAIFAAAVADYKPVFTATEKIKKEEHSGIHVQLVPNPDIALTLGSEKLQDTVHVGFALETENGIANARKKLEKKNFDMVVLNEPGENTGFQSDTNKATLLFKNNSIQSKELPLMTKKELAVHIIDELTSLLDRD